MKLIKLNEKPVTIISLKMFGLNIFFACNYFYRRRFNVQSLTDVFVPNKVSSTNEDIYFLISMNNKVKLLPLVEQLVVLLKLKFP